MNEEGLMISTYVIEYNDDEPIVKNLYCSNIEKLSA